MTHTRKLIAGAAAGLLFTTPAFGFGGKKPCHGCGSSGAGGAAVTTTATITSYGAVTSLAAPTVVSSVTNSTPLFFSVPNVAPTTLAFHSQAVTGLSYTAVAPSTTTTLYFGPPPAAAPNAGCTGTPGDAGLALAVQSLTVAVNANTQALNQRPTPPVGPPVPPPLGGFPPLDRTNPFGSPSGAGLSSVADPATGLPATTLDFPRALLTVQQSLGQGQKGAAIGVYNHAVFQHQSNQQSIDAMKAALTQAGIKVQ